MGESARVRRAQMMNDDHASKPRGWGARLTIYGAVTLAAGCSLRSLAYLQSDASDGPADANADSATEDAPIEASEDARSDASADAATDSAIQDATPSECDGAVVDFSCGSDLGANGMVAYWPLDEASGGTVHDCTSNGTDGILASWDGGAPLPTWGPGHHGGALLFDGAGGFVDLGTPSDLRIGGALTMSAWVRSSPQGNQAVQATVVGTDIWWVYLRAGSAGITVESMGAGYVTLSTGNVVASGQWTHMVGVFQPGGTLEVYVGGQRKGNLSVDAGNPYTNPARARIGANSLGDFFAGAIDDVRIFKRALSPCEIGALATP
jgi:hypothetical protein